MQTTSLSSKGQVVLPLRLRSAHGWKPGTAFEVRDMPEGVLLTPIASPPAFAPTRLDDVFGIATSPRGRVSLADMDAAVQAEAARQR